MFVTGLEKLTICRNNTAQGGCLQSEKGSSQAVKAKSYNYYFSGNKMHSKLKIVFQTYVLGDLE